MINIPKLRSQISEMYLHVNEGPKLVDETQINHGWKAETGKKLIQNKESLENLMYRCKHLMWKLVNFHIGK